MTKQEWIALFCCILIALLGLRIAWICHDGNWFARSGAILCIVAVIFAYLELRTRLAGVPGFVDAHLRKASETVVEKILAGGADRTTAETAARKFESDVMSEVTAEVEQTRKRLLRFEASLLVVGTLIWGFGDLPVDFLLHHCPH
jgi:hypothetical protein